MQVAEVLLSGCGSNAETAFTDANDTPDSIEVVEITMEQLMEANASERLLERFGATRYMPYMIQAQTMK